jgi:DNA polymerase-3 subunit delta'
MRNVAEWPVEVVPWLEQEFQQIVAQISDDRLPHALLLAGESHQGKTSFARAVATYLLCKDSDQGRVCGKCKGCHLAAAGSHPDLHIVEPIESRVIVVKSIRELVSWANQTAQQAGSKVAIIKPAEAMNIAAANALLKCLEEPAANTIIILVSDRPGRLLATVRSRCQQISVGNPDRQLAEDYLKERITDTEDIPALLEIARGRPIKALEMQTLGVLEQRRLLHQVLQEVWCGDLLPHAGAQQLMQNDPEQSLEMLYLWLTKMIKSAQSGQLKRNINNKLDKLFNELYKDGKLTGIYEFYDRLFHQWTVLQSGSNPNKQMVIENVLVEFAALSPERLNG